MSSIVEPIFNEFLLQTHDKPLTQEQLKQLRFTYYAGIAGAFRIIHERPDSVSLPTVLDKLAKELRENLITSKL